ncbi:hypothetical protein [Cellulomonas soli]
MFASLLQAIPAPLRLAATRLHRRVSGPDAERGDVPGWVLVTLMTAGLVTALWLVAGPALEGVFTDAIESVQGPAGP